MADKEPTYPEFYMNEKGLLTRRSLIKGVGAITISSAIGMGALAQGEAQISKGEVSSEEGEHSIHAVCTVNCTSRCHLQGIVRDGRIVRVEPGDMPGRPGYGNACLRLMSLSQRIQDTNARVMYPMKRTGNRGEGRFERITWDEAMDTIAEKLNAVIAEDPKMASFYSFTGDLGKLSWEAPTRYAACIGATTWDIEGIMGDRGATMGMTMVFGSGRGAHDSRDYMNSNLLIIWGRNLADTHTSELRDYVAAHKNGCKIIVIDPRMSSTAAMADEWIGIRPQTDPALALGMMNYIISNGLHDKVGLAAYSCAPYLIREDDKKYLRDAQGNYLVWDTITNDAVVAPAGADVAAGKVEPSLSGNYLVNGVACRTAFDHLVDSAAPYTSEHVAEICGINADTVVRLAEEYIDAQPAAIRMGQGMQRVHHSYSPFRTVATLAMVAGYIGVKGGGASHAGGTSTTRPVAGYTGPVFNFTNWANTGKNANMLSTSVLYTAAEDQDPMPIKFMWFANSNFINMSPDANRIVNKVIPGMDFIVCVDPFWTWTAKYADIVLPACTYWEHWDIINRSPWVMFNQPGIKPLGESKSDVEIMTMLAQRTSVDQYWDKVDEEWIREFVSTDHPAWADFDWDRDVVQNGIYGRSDADYGPAIVYADGKGYKTDTGKFEFYTEKMIPFDDEVPTWNPPAENPRGELGKKYPLVFIQYHDRLNVHTQHILGPALDLVETEQVLQMNPVDARARGISHGDLVRVCNDRGDMTVRLFETEGIVPGTVAVQSGWTPDYTIEGNYQTLTHFTICDAEEAYSETNSPFYDVLVEVEKA